MKNEIQLRLMTASNSSAVLFVLFVIHSDLPRRRDWQVQTVNPPQIKVAQSVDSFQ
jgi:hypothetical protein